MKMTVFKPVIRFYLWEGLQFITGLAALAGLMFGVSNSKIPVLAVLPCGFWFTFLMGTGAYGLYKLSRARIKIGELSLDARYHDAHTSVPWKDVLYARQMGHHIELWRGQEPLLISLKLFDINALWREMEVHALLGSLTDAAASNIESLQKRMDNYERLSRDDSSPVLFKHRRTSTITWLSIPLGFLVIHVILSVAASMNSGLFLLIFTLPIGVFAILMAWNRSLQFEISASKVTLFNRVISRDLPWEDIHEFSASRGSYSVTFAGTKRRLVAPGIREWGDEADEIFDMLAANLWRHQIKVTDLSRNYPFFQMAVLPKAIEQ